MDFNIAIWKASWNKPSSFNLSVKVKVYESQWSQISYPKVILIHNNVQWQCQWSTYRPLKLKDSGIISGSIKVYSIVPRPICYKNPPARTNCK